MAKKPTPAAVQRFIIEIEKLRATEAEVFALWNKLSPAHRAAVRAEDRPTERPVTGDVKFDLLMAGFHVGILAEKFVTLDDELEQIKEKRTAPKGYSKEVMQMTHRERERRGPDGKKTKWIVVFNRLKDIPGFPFGSKDSMEQAYCRQKDAHPEWFTEG